MLAIKKDGCNHIAGCRVEFQYLLTLAHWGSLVSPTTHLGWPMALGVVVNFYGDDIVVILPRFTPRRQ